MSSITDKPTCLLEEWDHTREQCGIKPGPDAVQARRLYYSGAMAALVLLGRGAKYEALRAETLAFARTIGTSVERS